MQCCVFPAHHWHFSRTSHQKTCSFILQIYTLSLEIYIHQLTWHSVFIHLHTANQFPLSSSLLTQLRQRANVAETQSMEWKVIMFTCLKVSGRAAMHFFPPAPVVCRELRDYHTEYEYGKMARAPVTLVVGNFYSNPLTQFRFFVCDQIV